MKKTIKLIVAACLLCAGCGKTDNETMLEALFLDGGALSITGVLLNPSTLSLAIGASDTLTVEVQPANAVNKNLTWQSSNGGVATVSNGLVTAVAVGTATITVTTIDGGKTATCDLTVKSESDGFYSANGASFSLVAVAGGTFSMGSTSGDAEEAPVHSVTLNDFAIGRHEVTLGLWSAAMGSTLTTTGWGSNYPVYYVNWNEIVGTSGSVGYTVNGVSYYTNGFCCKLSQLLGGNKQFCLPTEAEWEYAARGGSQSSGYEYSGSDSIDNVAWYSDNSGGTMHAVGTKAANELGIYDMSGNMAEWCSDWYGSYSSSAETNPIGAASGTYRVFRGGGWGGNYGCRVTYRERVTPNTRLSVGFRLALH
jgi:formylglycine-generating enzyme required for sulfatase activity